MASMHSHFEIYIYSLSDLLSYEKWKIQMLPVQFIEEILSIF